jgi:hypothetical protein
MHVRELPMTRSQVTACALALVVLNVVALVACALHNPVNVDPNYPPEPPIEVHVGDAGAGG